MPAPDGTLIASGKVRDLYDLGDGTLLMVASDRISAFDVVLPTLIPDKGRVLTGMTRYWLGVSKGIARNHLLGTAPDELPSFARTPEFAGRSMRCTRLEMLPVECVVRGYLAGSAWRDYRETGSVGGFDLPAGLTEASRLEEPIFTPATKAAPGEHDVNLDRAEAAALLGPDRYRELAATSLALYRLAAGHASARGIILADTKFEFGLDGAGAIVLGDEVLTPDSSRFWPAAQYEPGTSPPSFDKQYVRDWLEASGWDKTPPAPVLPDAVRDGTASRYRDAFERITGAGFGAYLEEMGVAT
jgi:phosphoribosylaminoimidazole-succinocarboxamide synthase